MTKKLAVIFPGIGYHKFMPLLYYPHDILEFEGYEIRDIEFRDLPKKDAGEPACRQAAEQLDQMDLKSFDDVIFVCKSIGTIAASHYVMTHDIKVRQIWYTPLQYTFDLRDGKPDNGSIIAFIGTADRWSDLGYIRDSAAKLNIDLHLYDDCNHSLECRDVLRNIDIIHDVMDTTTKFLFGK